MNTKSISLRVSRLLLLAIAFMLSLSHVHGQDIEGGGINGTAVGVSEQGRQAVP